MIQAKSFSDILNITSFQSDKADLTTKDYHILFDFKNQHPAPFYFLKFFIIDKLPIHCFPFSFHEQVDYLKDINYAERLLDKTYKFQGEAIELTLYQIIKKYGKIPNRIIDVKQQDVFTLLENYQSKKFIYRFFQNQGKVFFSESMKNIQEHQFKHIAYLLFEKGILRKGVSFDLPEILNFKTKKEIINIIESNDIKHSLGANYLNKTKELIIQSIVKNYQMQELDLPAYFYFLSDKYQDFKEWIEKEEIYFKVFCFLNRRIQVAYIGLDDLMKDLIRIDEFELAHRIGQLYFSLKDYFRQSSNYHETWDDERVKIQMEKIKKSTTHNK